MAKKEEAKSNLLDDIFAQLIGQHNKISPNSSTLGTHMESEIRYWIDTGSLMLNMALSNKPDGGWPCGRIVEVFGKESIGKSTLGYVGLANCQKAGGISIFADIEKSGNKKFMEMLGIDLTKLVYVDTPEIEKLFEALQQNLITIASVPALKKKPTFIVIDSSTALQTDAEMESGYEYNMNVAMGKAKQLGKALKKIIPYLSKANACLYFVSQVRDNTSGYGQSWIVPGGKAIPFYSSIRVHLEGKTKIVVKDPTLDLEYEKEMLAWKEAGGKKSGIEKPEKPKANKENETTIGYEVTAFTIKNKTAPADRRSQFRIIFSQGLFDEECWFEQLVKYGIIKPIGNNHEIVAFSNDLGKFHKNDWIEILQKNEEFYNKLKECLIDKLTIKFKFDDYKMETEDIDFTASNDDDYAIAKTKNVVEEESVDSEE